MLCRLIDVYPIKYLVSDMFQMYQQKAVDLLVITFVAMSPEAVIFLH
jgi:hypothetical protein